MVLPVPIPNTAVKHSIADGSSPIGSARVGSRQFFEKAGDPVSGFLLSLTQGLLPDSSANRSSERVILAH